MSEPSKVSPGGEEDHAGCVVAPVAAGFRLVFVATVKAERLKVQMQTCRLSFPPRR